MRDVLGQPRLLERLGERLEKGEASHAYLITGPRSIGKHTLALRIAQTLTCGGGSRPGGCGSCAACRKVERGSHPDVREIVRLPEKRDISIEQIREARRDLALRPLEATWRVVIVDDAAELSEDAQDALLKTLEEPPAHAVLLLVTRTPEALLPTVVSRCQILTLRPLPREGIEGLVRSRGADDATAALVASLAGGRPGLALRLAADAPARDARLARLDELFTLLGMGLLQRFGWANRAAAAIEDQDARADLAETFWLWLELLRDAAVGGEDAPRVHPDRAERTLRLGRLVGATQLVALAGLVARLRDDLERNSNPRTALELLMLRLPYLADFARAA